MQNGLWVDEGLKYGECYHIFKLDRRAGTNIRRPDDETYFAATSRDDDEEPSDSIAVSQEVQDSCPQASQLSPVTEAVSESVELNEESAVENQTYGVIQPPPLSTVKAPQRNIIAKGRQQGHNEAQVSMDGLANIPLAVKELTASWRARQQAQLLPVGSIEVEAFAKALDSVRELQESLGLKLTLQVMKWLKQDPKNAVMLKILR